MTEREGGTKPTSRPFNSLKSFKSFTVAAVFKKTGKAELSKKKLATRQGKP